MKIPLTRPKLWYIHIRTEYEESDELDALRELRDMTDDECREYAFRYLEYIIGINGTGDLMSSEWHMIRELGLAEELGVELPEEEPHETI